LLDLTRALPFSKTWPQSFNFKIRDFLLSRIQCVNGKMKIIDLFALFSIISGVLVITSKNPVVAIIFLISVFVNTAGYLMTSGILFVGIAYIIVYVGAITVLFLFVIMMLNIKIFEITERGSVFNQNLPLAFSVFGLLLFFINKILPFTINDINLIYFMLFNVPSIFFSISDLSFDLAFITNLQIQAIGQGLYTYGAIIFILSSFILLLAMIAPMAISRNEEVKK